MVYGEREYTPSTDLSRNSLSCCRKPKVVLILPLQYQAILIYGDPMKRKVAAKGKKRIDAKGALDGLLDVLADAVAHTFRERGMVEAVQFGRHSVVDMGLAD